MYRKVLVPLDNSPTDNVILDHIRPLARMTGADLVLVHVADGYVARLQDQLNLEDSEEIKKDRMYLDQCRQDLVKEGFQVKAFLVQGKEPVDGILEIADSQKCDLIALATHGHGFVQDIILGSVADDLRHRTDIPMLMIRSPMKGKG